MTLFYDVYSFHSEDEAKLSPKIFLHGLGEWRKTWMKVAPVIARNAGRKAYALDARNHGDSPWVPQMDYDCMTQDLLDFMDVQGIQKAIIVGHSMGGRTAINFALKHPRRTEALVVEDMTPRNLRSGFGTLVLHVFHLVKQLAEDIPPEMDIKSARQYFMDLALSAVDGEYIDAKKIKHYCDSDMVPLEKVGNSFKLKTNLDALTSMMESNALDQNLPKKNLIYNGDTLFLSGSMDPYRLFKDTSISKLFPEALKVKIEGASHMIHSDSADVFVEVVSNFIINRNLPRSKY